MTIYNKLLKGKAIVCLCNHCGNIILSSLPLPDQLLECSNQLVRELLNGRSITIIDMDDLQVTFSCKCSQALYFQSGFYPARWNNRVPKTVKMNKTVAPDMPWLVPGALICRIDHIYKVHTNQHGAVSAISDGGEMLGLKPDEFEIVEWYALPGEELPNA